MLDRHDARTAHCYVYTYKEGALSAVAHDLRLHADRFDLEVDRASHRVRMRVDASSLRVDGIMRGERLDPAGMAEDERAKVEEIVRTQILHSDRYPEITLNGWLEDEGSDSGTMQGDLTLHGVTRSVESRLRSEDGRVIAEIVLHQPDYGLRPYSAMFGAMRVRAQVRVVVEVPAPAASH